MFFGGLTIPLPPMGFQWFFTLLPSLSMVFDGSGPLVKRYDGFDGSLWSRPQRFLVKVKVASSPKDSVFQTKKMCLYEIRLLTTL